MNLSNIAQNSNGQIPNFDIEQFKKAINNLDENSLNKLIHQAKMLGMSTEQINQGLRYMQKIK